MREHHVCCQISGGKAAADIQNEVNVYTALYIRKCLAKGGLTKEEQLRIIDEVIGRLSVSNIDKDETDLLSLE